MPINYESARELLDENLATVEAELAHGIAPYPPQGTEAHFDQVFRSQTQAYREVLVGCALSRIQDRHINIRLPYVNQGKQAYNARTLDERVVNPFLQTHRIPCSRGPFLNVFRRSVRFDEATRSGLRDKEGYGALLVLITFLENTAEDAELEGFLHYLLFRFALLREAASIPLSRLHRVSLDQYDSFISGLLDIPSGGRLPVAVVLVTFQAIKEFFGLDWNIECMGINVADAASETGGDITIRQGEETLLAAEVTERPVGRSRVTATFNTKIGPHGIEEYLFFVRPGSADAEARRQAAQYFAQGHEVNFVEIKIWILMSLATMGRRGRDIFNRRLLNLVEDPKMPSSVKVGWNQQIERLIET